MAKIRNNAVARNAKEEYNAYVTAIERESSEIFLTNMEIETKHLEAEKKALEYFASHQMELNEASAILNELKRVIMLCFIIIYFILKKTLIRELI